jgi:hypothetical protein
LDIELDIELAKEKMYAPNIVDDDEAVKERNVDLHYH